MISLVNKSSEGVLRVSKSGLDEECVCKMCAVQSSKAQCTLLKCPVQIKKCCKVLFMILDIAGKQIKRGSVTRQQEWTGWLDEECVCKMCPAQSSSVQYKLYACKVVG